MQASGAQEVSHVPHNTLLPHRPNPYLLSRSRSLLAPKPKEKNIFHLPSLLHLHVLPFIHFISFNCPLTSPRPPFLPLTPGI